MCGFDMSNLSVALTTTGFLKETNASEIFETRLWKSNLPVCIAEISLFAFSPGMEEMEHRIAQSLKKYVFMSSFFTGIQQI